MQEEPKKEETLVPETVEQKTKENPTYPLAGVLPFTLEFSKTDDNKVQWGMNYETTLAAQMAAFGYVADCMRVVVEKMVERLKEQNKLNPQQYAKLGDAKITRTKLNKYNDVRSTLLMLIDEMIPTLYDQAKAKAKTKKPKKKIEVVQEIPSDLKGQ